jgi:hypothetical protein
MVTDGAELMIDARRIIIVKLPRDHPPLEVESRSMTSVETLYTHLNKSAIDIDTLRPWIVRDIHLNRHDDEPMHSKNDIWAASKEYMSPSYDDDGARMIPYFKVWDRQIFIRGDTHRDLIMMKDISEPNHQ